MPIYSKKEFASLTGQTTKTLSTYIGRKKVIVNENGFIDTTNELNAAFFELKGKKEPTKQSVPQIPHEETWIDPDAEDEKEIDNDGLPSLIVSEKRYKHALANKTEASDTLERLRIEKLKGEVVPTSPIEKLVFQFKQYILTQEKITYERFLVEVSHKYSITSEDMAYYRGQFIKLLNDSMKSATDEFKRDLGVILAEFSVKRK